MIKSDFSRYSFLTNLFSIRCFPPNEYKSCSNGNQFYRHKDDIHRSQCYLHEIVISNFIHKLKIIISIANEKYENCLPKIFRKSLKNLRNMKIFQRQEEVSLFRLILSFWSETTHRQTDRQIDRQTALMHKEISVR